jgi:nicotinate (nicotinamide) nucleotide adenylyltransferase
MKIAVLGGSFNPPHLCHVFICHYVLATAAVEQVWWIPCAQHAFGKMLASFHHRFTMCSLAVEVFRGNLVTVSAIEQERQGTSWTIDTVRDLKHRYPHHDFTWIIGSDTLDELDQWKDFDQLQHLISFLMVPRAGTVPEQGQPEANTNTVARPGCQHRAGKPAINKRENTAVANVLKSQVEEIALQGFQLPNISSTQIRERVKQQQPINHLVPRKIAQYIYTHNLYQT